MSIESEARAEAEKRWPVEDDLHPTERTLRFVARERYAEGYIAGASRPVTEHDRQVAERAFDVGFDKATSLVSEDFWSDAWSDDHSPYRAAKGEQQ